MNNANIEAKLDALAKTIHQDMGRSQQLAIIGIRTGGEALARHMALKIGLLCKCEIPVGMLDITLYRDDLDYKQATLHATEVPFPIDGKRILLVDDVLFTGRTVRSALNALSDLGRPAKIELMCLVDRGHRELPIRPDYVGFEMTTQPKDRVKVLYDDQQGWSVVVQHGA